MSKFQDNYVVICLFWTQVKGPQHNAHQAHYFANILTHLWYSVESEDILQSRDPLCCGFTSDCRDLSPCDSQFIIVRSMDINISTRPRPLFYRVITGYCSEALITKCIVGTILVHFSTFLHYLLHPLGSPSHFVSAKLVLQFQVSCISVHNQTYFTASSALTVQFQSSN